MRKFVAGIKKNPLCFPFFSAIVWHCRRSLSLQPPTDEEKLQAKKKSFKFNLLTFQDTERDVEYQIASFFLHHRLHPRNFPTKIFFDFFPYANHEKRFIIANASL
jgi:hypothetical protein